MKTIAKMDIYQYKKTDRNLVDFGSFFLAIMLIAGSFTPTGSFIFLVVGVSLGISVSGRLFWPDMWELNVTQGEVKWEAPDRSGCIEFSDIESVYHNVRENSIVLISRSDESYSIPSKCIDKNEDAIDAIRGVGVALNLKINNLE